ncbi:hypothetical protein NX059_006647 [Plenodomus lindquistii]|nr:hypothetical protein NX059_006647 [Plenodomus lindquistii]
MAFTKSAVLATVALIALAPLSAAHMVLKEPVPYGEQTKDPLAENGSNFPCKAIPYTVKSMNQWPVGSTQQLVFTGSATHGGGSCQVSVTTDKEPTKSSKWKVIHSFEGGCPNSFDGNLPDGTNSDTTFPFQVPSELPNGELTMAWTWFNHIGNREMYMACSPIAVTGGASDNKEFDALPDMAIANIDVPGSCGTTEPMVDYTFANPGKYVSKGGKGVFKPLCANQASTGNGDAPAQAPAPAAPSAALPVAPPAPSSANAQLSTLRTIVTVTAPMGSPSSPGSAPTASAAPAPAPTTPASAPQAPTAPLRPIPGPAGSNGTPCSPDGSIVCSADGTQFGLCNFGTAVFQPVAAGTKCNNGVIGKRDFTHRVRRAAV